MRNLLDYTKQLYHEDCLETSNIRECNEICTIQDNFSLDSVAADEVSSKFRTKITKSMKSSYSKRNAIDKLTFEEVQCTCIVRDPRSKKVGRSRVESSPPPGVTRGQLNTGPVFLA